MTSLTSLVLVMCLCMCLYYAQLTAAMQPLRPYEKLDTLRQFLEHDRQVLRFNCHWDDTGRLGGRERERE